jgi:benzoate/toluate 1,2-dioxygenase subunit beta
MLTVAAPLPLAGPADAPLAIAEVTADIQRAVELLLYRQADCLDTKRWTDFIDLFAPDGVYWMPAQPHQTTGDGEPSIFYEDRDLMRIRLKRLGHPRAWSQKTEWATSHVVSNVIIERHDPTTGAIACRSRFYMMEYRRDAVRPFAGSNIHQLVRTEAGYRIKLQRVDMVNGEAPYDYVLQAWV